MFLTQQSYNSLNHLIQWILGFNSEKCSLEEDSKMAADYQESLSTCFQHQTGLVAKLQSIQLEKPVEM